ncbi:ribosome biogenesis GTPase Der [secondary endosymbiont of Ctenarytaina eucalypti]|uniref:GTPase Der n=1 Tax=secondary endosymbiont of Ctenarytaina eucalypti TaxID=1199245 RepID=J3TFW1_9ENTR|nr:ribosome biogenesis GTPase Der [secondary endosymbiont of Ctenarytaina eucalypti]AFP85212.1 ribosome-associated GTPase EngA [secondary endosymbiont of Ctenarytaina eucalypti]
MLPVIALVGRQNVGKSTLFNRLTRTHDALVADFPGLTRDRNYGHAKWAGNEFIVIDTGGIDGKEEGVEIHVAGQSLSAIEEADIVLFMVDGRAGMMAGDQVIAKHLRRRQKTTLLVVNKTDGIHIDSIVGDFYSLGLAHIVPIAASQGQGISSLLEQVILPFQKNNLLADEAGEDAHSPWPEDAAEALPKEKEQTQHFNPRMLPIKLAIVGRPNVGKSTLINRILGEQRVVVYDMPGTTRDSLYIPMVHKTQKYILIDTAGVRKRGQVTETVDKFSIIKTLKAIGDANVVLLLIDALVGIADQDLSLLSFILNRGRSLVIAVNKWDDLSNNTRNNIKKVLDQRLGFIDFARVHYISALHGSGVEYLLESVNAAYQCATTRVSAALLTRIMCMAVGEHQPPLVRGRRIKPKYAHPGGYNPPLIVIHGSQVNDLPHSYKKYLINYFRRSLKIIGAPIRIQFKETINPFSGNRNILTLRQLHKRNRLMRYVKNDK